MKNKTTLSSLKFGDRFSFTDDESNRVFLFDYRTDSAFYYTKEGSASMQNTNCDREVVINRKTDWSRFDPSKTPNGI
jgi:hypothetical protein